eukprot:scaffold24410_cov108-Cylindrotheca_fusiformis.AAC.4
MVGNMNAMKSSDLPWKGHSKRRLHYSVLKAEAPANAWTLVQDHLWGSPATRKLCQGCTRVPKNIRRNML